jgi:hypothetical protein
VSEPPLDVQMRSAAGKALYSGLTEDASDPRCSGPAIDNDSDIWQPIPRGGRCLVSNRSATHDWPMTPSQRPQPAGPAAVRRVRPLTALLVTNLEGFWSSRRGHAFDELCR